MSVNKIGMVVAMEEEIIPFLDKFGVQQEAFVGGGYKIIIYKLENKEIYIVKSGVGEIFAAAATQYLITKFGVETIINFGVVGALSDKLDLTAVVLVKGVVHYDFDTSAIDGCPAGRYFCFDETVVKTDENLLKKAENLCPGMKTVICASADKFVVSPKIKEKLRNDYGADICEMESAGILFTCKNNKVPCLIVKAVSDGTGGAEDFEKMLSAASKAYVDLLIKILNVL